MALPSEIDTGSGLVPRGDLTPISEEELFEDALPQIEKTHYATGGTNGIMNIAAWILGNRTKWLKAKIDALISIGANIASASTTNIGASTGNTLHVTGTTTITSFGTATTGARRTLIFDGILTLTHNATTLILPTGANIVTAVGDTAEFVKEADGWRCVDYLRKDGKALASIDFSSQEEVNAGLVANKAIAPDTLKGAFPKGTGYQKLPNGLILQWGTYPATAGAVVTFPIAFTAAPFFVNCIIDTVSSAYNDYASSVSATSWTIGSSPDGGKYFAIGY